MNKSLLDIVSKCRALLFQVPDMVDQLSQRDVHFIQVFTDWLREAEDFLKQYNYPQCSEIAGFRSQLLTPLLSVEKNVSRRKEQLHVASSLIHPSQNVLLAVVEPVEYKVSQAKEIISQILQLAKQAGMIRYEKHIDFNTYLMGLLEMFKNHEQLKPSMTKALTLVNQSDLLRIMAEEIDFT
ncbi:MAG: hypothetical protein HRT68_11960 [Flavobacteriaceae bacterium]|nr:hypothetical protein [Flavobacteriaceae bacterium]